MACGFVSVPTPVVGRVAHPRGDQALASLRLIREKNSSGQGYPVPTRYDLPVAGSKPSYRLTHVRTRLLTGTKTQVTEPKPSWSKREPSAVTCASDSLHNTGGREFISQLR